MLNKRLLRKDSVLPRNDEHGEQLSVGKPRNEIASSCLTALLAMTGGREPSGTPRNDVLPLLSLRGAKRRGNLRALRCRRTSHCHCEDALASEAISGPRICPSPKGCHCEGHSCGPWQSTVVVSQLGGNSKSTGKERLLRKDSVLPRNDEHGEQLSVGKPRNEIASSCLWHSSQ